MTKISINGYEPAHLSFSTVSGWRSCGKRFELSRVLHLEELPGLAAIGGNAVHTATEKVDLLIEQHGFDFLSSEVDNGRVEVAP